jgi:hypothetical protein
MGVVHLVKLLGLLAAKGGSMERIKIRIEYSWAPVLKNDDSEYLFPDPKGSIKAEYNSPAVYRWNISVSGEQRMYYIGEAQNLRERVYGYLNPGRSQQTNDRINRLLSQSYFLGFRASLAILDNLMVSTDTGIDFSKKDLESKHFRQFVEGLLISISREGGEIIYNR